MKILRWLVTSTLVSLTAACSTSDYYFDSGDAPSWTRGGDSTSGRELRAVGLSPVTQDVARDRQRALDDAKSKLGQIVNSRVESVHRDFVAAGFMGAQGESTSVQVQSIKVESAVELNEVKTLATFRDETTKTQYVQVSVDRGVWLSRVEDKLQADLAKLQSLADEVSAQEAEGHLIELIKLRDRGRSISSRLQSRVTVAQVLGAQEKWRETVERRQVFLTQLSDDLKNGLAVKIKCVDTSSGNTCAYFEQGMRAFWDSIGVGRAASDARAVLTVDAQLVIQNEGEVAVGRALEYRFSSGYKIRVILPNGQPLPSLELELPLGDRVSRAPTAAKAQEMAEDVAGEDALSVIRNALRKEIRSDSD